jgi:hypothetical protein
MVFQEYKINKTIKESSAEKRKMFYLNYKSSQKSTPAHTQHCLISKKYVNESRITSGELQSKQEDKEVANGTIP